MINLPEIDKHILQLVEELPLATVISTGNTERILMLNNAFTELFGYDQSDFPSVDDWWMRAYPDAAYRAEIKATWTAAAKKAIETCSAVDPVEATITCKDGSTRETEVNMASIGMLNIVTFVDVTEHKRAQEEHEQQLAFSISSRDALLQISKLSCDTLDAFFSQLVEIDAKTILATQVGIWFFSEDHSEFIQRDTYLIDTDTHEYGDLVNRPNYPKYFAALDAGRIIDACDARNDPRTSEFTESYLIPNDFVSMLDAPIRRNGKVIGAVCHEQAGKEPKIWTRLEQDFAASVADMVAVGLESFERKQAQESLESSEEFLSAAINAMDEMIHVVDCDLCVVLANDAFRREIRTLGLQTECVGRPIRELCPFLPAKVFNEYASVFKNGTNLSTEEVSLVQGHLYYTETTKIPIFEGNKVVRVLTKISDITERKKAEEARRASEERTRAILDTAMAGFWLTDMEGRLLEVNETYCQMSGYTAQELLEMRIFDLDATEPKDDTAARIKKIAAQGEDRFESRHRRKDGSVFDVDVSVQYRPAEGGKFVVFLQDITERKRAGESLRESEDRFRRAVYNAPFPIMIHTEDGNVLNLSQGWTDISGYDISDIPTIDAWTELAYGVHKQSLLEEIEALHQLELRKDEGEYTIICRDGSKRVWDFSSASIGKLEDGRHAVISMAKDVTNRKNAEEALQESERKYRLLFENMTAGFALHEMIYDENGTAVDYRYLEINPAFEKLTGVPASDLLGKTVKEVMPNTEQYWIDTYARVAETGEPIAYQNYSKEIGKYYDTWSFSPCKGQFAVVFYDISERKQAENEAAASRAEAEKRAAEMESFVSNIADGVALYDIAGNLVAMNHAGRTILGAPQDESFVNWLIRAEYYALDGVRLLDDQIPAKRALHGETVRDLRVIIKTPWGKELGISASVSPIISPQGDLLGATVVFRDQSERIELEQKREELYERERKIAKALQEALLPHELPVMPGCETAVIYEAASREAEVGGDFYDAFEIGNGKLALSVGDVTGKGLPAAARVASARHTIRSCTHIDSNPSKVMTLANEVLCKSIVGVDQGILTAVFAVVDTDTGHVTISNGGHEPVVLRKASGDVEQICVEGRVLGVLGGFTYPEVTYKLDPGDMFVMVTDGITESRGSDGEFFGIEGVMDFLAKTSLNSPSEIAAGLLDTAKTHCGGSLRDDVAVLVLVMKDKSS